MVDLLLVVDHVFGPDQLLHDVHQLGCWAQVVFIDPIHASVVPHSKEEAGDVLLVCEVGDGIPYLHKASCKLVE